MNDHTDNQSVEQTRRLLENEASLATALQRLKAHMDNSPLAVIEFDDHFRVLQWSKGAERVFGWTSEQVVGRSISEMRWVHEEDAELVQRESAGLLSGERSRSMSINRNYRSDGSVIPCEWHNSGIYAGGNLISILSFVLDTTDRHEAQAALRESQSKFAAALSSMVDAVFISDVSGQFIDFNDAFASFHRFKSKAECATKLADYPDILDVFFSDGKPAPLDMWAVPRALRGETVNNAEYILRRKDTGETWVGSYSFSPVRDEKGSIVGSVVVGRDITEAKRTETALRESEEKFRRVVEASPIAKYFLRLEDGERLVMTGGNPAADRTIGINHLELMGKTIEEAFPGLVGTEVPGIFRQVAKGEIAAQSLEVPYQDHRFSGHFEVQAFQTNTNEIALDFIDVSERRKAEADKLALERQVQHAQKLESLGVLAGGIAHDFNNLLMAILGNADLALDELSPMSPARGNILAIEKASKRAAELAKQMLAYSGKGRFVIEPIDAGKLTEEMAHLLEVSVSKRVVLKYNFSPNLPTFDGDATQIRQIVMNLITNASESIGEKSGVIALSTGAMCCDRAYLDGVNEVLRAALDDTLPEGVYVYFEVADTGCGMDATTVAKIFDPFFTTKFTGRGLGMSAVLGIVRGHKGAIKIYSEIGKGTTFKILFPANDFDDGGAAQRESDELAVDWRGTGTVLVADDEESVCAVGRQMLERMGFQALTAPDGREALKLFREHSDAITCVLLDLTMPHMDGEETFRELRRICPGITVVLCSGYNEQDAIQRFAGKGLAGFIQKPYNMATLRNKLREVLKTQ